jgi:hypothetical protein
MIIKEFLPNPAGDDKAGEYIKLLNDGNKQINLSGWSVKDASGKTFRLSGFLDAGQELVLPYSQTKIALNNDGEQVLLYDAGGNLVDELSYTGKAADGQLITKIEKGVSGSEQSQLFNYPISNYSINSNFIFLNFLIAAILAGLGLYVTLKLEKKLDQNLF